MDKVERLSVIRLTPDGHSRVEVVVAQEFFATIFFNGKELATLLCSPNDLDYLAAGFLFSEDLIKGKDDIEKIEVDDKLGVIRVNTKNAVQGDARNASPRLIASGCGGAANFYSIQDAELLRVDSRLEIRAEDVFSLVKTFQHYSTTYLATHGTHSAALSDADGIVVFSEDIGRHNAIDKLFGKCLLEDIPTADRLILTSGRVSFEILQKVTKRAVPVVISISTPLSLGAKMADKLGVTLIGSVRSRSMYVYSHPQRIIDLVSQTMSQDIGEMELDRPANPAG
ncbi:MAG: formate dehydrogenase accessory sulfurtransferase FdhD [Dehalococcoidales bacterium]